MKRQMTHGSETANYEGLLMQTLPRSITTEEEADRIQRQIDALIDKEGELTEAEEDLLSLLGDLIYAWEDGKYDLPDVPPTEIIKALLEAHGLRQKDLVGSVFPTEGIASEVLNGKRRLTYDFVQRLANFFHVSPAVFFEDGKGTAEG